MLVPRRRCAAALHLLLALCACDETAQPRPPQAGSDAAVDAGGTGGSAGAGSGGSAGAGSGGLGGSRPCEAFPPPISPASLPAAKLGQAYAQRLMIPGATAAQVSWQAEGALPPGLSLVEDETPSSGPPQEARADLSGTPTAAGTYAFEVVVAFTGSSACATPPARRSYELVVTDRDADAGE